MNSCRQFRPQIPYPLGRYSVKADPRSGKRTPERHLSAQEAISLGNLLSEREQSEDDTTEPIQAARYECFLLPFIQILSNYDSQINHLLFVENFDAARFFSFWMDISGISIRLYLHLLNRRS
jgi:hypothetical protein